MLPLSITGTTTLRSREALTQGIPPLLSPGSSLGTLLGPLDSGMHEQGARYPPWYTQGVVGGMYPGWSTSSYTQECVYTRYPSPTHRCIPGMPTIPTVVHTRHAHPTRRRRLYALQGL